MPAAAAIKRKLRQLSKSVSCLEVSRVVPKPRAQADKHGGLCSVLRPVPKCKRTNLRSPNEAPDAIHGGGG